MKLGLWLHMGMDILKQALVLQCFLFFTVHRVLNSGSVSGFLVDSSRKHSYIIFDPLNPTFI